MRLIGLRFKFTNGDPAPRLWPAIRGRSPPRASPDITDIVAAVESMIIESAAGSFDPDITAVPRTGRLHAAWLTRWELYCKIGVQRQQDVQDPLPKMALRVDGRSARGRNAVKAAARGVVEKAPASSFNRWAKPQTKTPGRRRFSSRVHWACRSQVTSKRDFRRIQQGLGRLASDGQGLTRAAIAGARLLGSPERAAARDPVGAPWAPLALSALRHRRRGPILLRIHRVPALARAFARRFIVENLRKALRRFHTSGTRKMPARPDLPVMPGGERPYLQVMGEAIGERIAGCCVSVSYDDPRAAALRERPTQAGRARSFGRRGAMGCAGSRLSAQRALVCVVPTEDRFTRSAATCGE